MTSNSLHLFGGSGGLGGGLVFTEEELILVLLKELSRSVLIKEQRIHPLNIININLCTLEEEERAREREKRCTYMHVFDNKGSQQDTK